MLTRICKYLSVGVFGVVLAMTMPAGAADVLTDSEVHSIEAGSSVHSLTLEQPFRCHGEVPRDALLCGYGIGVVRLHIALEHASAKGLTVRLAHRQWIRPPQEAHPRAKEWCARYDRAEELILTEPLTLPADGTGFIDLQEFASQSPRGEWLLLVDAPQSNGWLQGWGIEIGYRFDATNPNFPRPGAEGWCVTGNNVPASAAQWSHVTGSDRMTVWFDYADGPFGEQHNSDVITRQAEVFYLLDTLYFGGGQEYPNRMAGTLFNPPGHPVQVFVSGGGGQSRGGGRWLRVSGNGTQVRPRVAAHEFGHRVCRGYANNRPPWFNEGMAVTMETTVVDAPEQQEKGMAARFGPRSMIPGLYDGAYRHSAFWGFLASRFGLYTQRQRSVSAIKGSSVVLEPLKAATFFVDALAAFRSNPKTDKRQVLRQVSGASSFGDLFCDYMAHMQTSATELNPTDRRSIMQYTPVASPVDTTGVSVDFGYNAGLLPAGDGTICVIARCGASGSITVGDVQLCSQEGFLQACLDAGAPLDIRGDASVYRVDMGHGIAGWKQLDETKNPAGVMWQMSEHKGVPKATKREHTVCRRDHVADVNGSRLLLVARTGEGSLALENKKGTPHSLLGWHGSYGLNRHNTLGALTMVELAADPGGVAQAAMALYADAQPMIYALMTADPGPPPMAGLRFGAVRPYGAVTHRFAVPKTATQVSIKRVTTGVLSEKENMRAVLLAVLDYPEYGRQLITGPGCFGGSTLLDIPLDDGTGLPLAVEVTVIGIPKDDAPVKDQWVPYGIAVAFDGYGYVME